MPTPRQYTSNAERQRAYRERLEARKRAILEGQLPKAPALSNIPPVKRWNGMRERASGLLTELREEMQTYVDDRSEEWQESERASAFQEKIDLLDSILGDLENWEE